MRSNPHTFGYVITFVYIAVDSRMRDAYKCSIICFCRAARTTHQEGALGVIASTRAKVGQGQTILERWQPVCADHALNNLDTYYESIYFQTHIADFPGS
jgi:hypothetical protein